MAKIIKDGGIVDDPWHLLSADVAEVYPAGRSIQGTEVAEKLLSGKLEQGKPEPGKKLIVPLAVWRRWASDFSRCDSTPGVWIEVDQDLDEMADVIAQVPIIAVHFPSFVNGSGFSVGTLLRELYQFGGELRAFGELILDQVPYLRRCGFNAITLAKEQQLEFALQLLQDAGLTYQGSVFSPRTPFQLRYETHSGDEYDPERRD